MNEKESKAYYLGGLVVGFCYLFTTLIFLVYSYFFGHVLLFMSIPLIIMLCVNLSLVYEYIKLKRKLGENLK